jgi:hypothetical protein
MEHLWGHNHSVLSVAQLEGALSRLSCTGRVMSEKSHVWVDLRIWCIMILSLAHPVAQSKRSQSCRLATRRYNPQLSRCARAPRPLWLNSSCIEPIRHSINPLYIERVYISPFRPVARRWLCKQWPLLDNAHNIHGRNNRRAKYIVTCLPSVAPSTSQYVYIYIHTWAWTDESLHQLRYSLEVRRIRSLL